MNRILIAESDRELALQIKGIFADKRTHPVSCDTVEKTRDMLRCEKWSVALVAEEMAEVLEDVDDETIVVLLMSPGPNLAAMRRQGVSDFIQKPFNPIVLKAKVFTLLKNRNCNTGYESSARFDALGTAFHEFIPGGAVICIDKYRFDFDNKEYQYKNQKIRLGDLEQGLLRMLVENRGAVLKKNALLERLQAESRIKLDGDILAQTVDRLLEKLRAESYIKTIYGIGYMWMERRE